MHVCLYYLYKVWRVCGCNFVRACAFASTYVLTDIHIIRYHVCKYVCVDASMPVSCSRGFELIVGESWLVLMGHDLKTVFIWVP